MVKGELKSTSKRKKILSDLADQIIYFGWPKGPIRIYDYGVEFFTPKVSKKKQIFPPPKKKIVDQII